MKKRRLIGIITAGILSAATVLTGLGTGLTYAEDTETVTQISGDNSADTSTKESAQVTNGEAQNIQETTVTNEEKNQSADKYIEGSLDVSDEDNVEIVLTDTEEKEGLMSVQYYGYQYQEKVLDDVKLYEKEDLGGKTTTDSPYAENYEKLINNKPIGGIVYSELQPFINKDNSYVIPGIRNIKTFRGDNAYNSYSGMCVAEEFILVSGLCSDSNSGVGSIYKRDSIISVIDKNSKEYISTLVVGNSSNWINSLAYNDGDVFFYDINGSIINKISIEKIRDACKTDPSEIVLNAVGGYNFRHCLL